MALTVAGISLTVGIYMLAKASMPDVGGWADTQELCVGAAIMSGLLAAFRFAMATTRQRRCMAAHPAQTLLRIG